MPKYKKLEIDEIAQTAKEVRGRDRVMVVLYCNHDERAKVSADCDNLSMVTFHLTHDNFEDFLIHGLDGIDVILCQKWLFAANLTVGRRIDFLSGHALCVIDADKESDHPLLFQAASKFAHYDVPHEEVVYFTGYMPINPLMDDKDIRERVEAGIYRPGFEFGTRHGIHRLLDEKISDQVGKLSLNDVESRDKSGYSEQSCSKCGVIGVDLSANTKECIYCFTGQERPADSPFQPPKQ